MINVGNELRNIAITRVAKAYLCHRLKSALICFSTELPTDPLLMDLSLILISKKIYIKEGARDLNVRLDGDMAIQPGYYHHTRRHGLLTSYEAMLFSNKVEAYLRNEVYSDIAKRPRSAGRIIDEWGDRLDLDPTWSENMTRTYRNHRLHNYPVFAA
jgi:hypothetical protein